MFGDSVNASVIKKVKRSTVLYTRPSTTPATIRVTLTMATATFTLCVNESCLKHFAHKFIVIIFVFGPMLTR